MALLLVLAGAVATLRFGVLLPAVRDAIETQTDGLRVGPLGRLRIEGLGGDLWRDPTAQRLTLRDKNGIWLEARNIKISWDYTKILRREFAADNIDVESIRLLRRPILSPGRPFRGLPASIRIARAHSRLILEPGFSSERGVYDVDLTMSLARKGAKAGRVHAASLLHAGDRATVDFSMSRAGRLLLAGNAEEADGGALAGALGLPVDQTFRAFIRADGTLSKGSFVARATSGPVALLETSGAWNPQGGQGSGRINLRASTLTTWVSDRFGPEGRFDVRGAKAVSGGYAIDGRVLTEAANARVWGVGDPGKMKLAPGGLRVDIQAPSLSRIIVGPTLGAARVSGVLTGERAAWRFSGTGVVADAALGGYSLTRFGGPIELEHTKTEYVLRTDMKGAGGRGDSYLTATLGGAPTVRLTIARLADRQILVRRLDVEGSGLTLQASGERTLLGAYSFQGKARVFNLAATRSGASGGFTVTGSARKGGGESPWAVDVKASGERLTLGLAELDRLLGRSPVLTAQASWQAGRLSVARSRLKGLAAEAGVTGALAADGALAFNMDWTASGPLGLGPLDISGRADGTGSIRGTLQAPRLELLADLEQIELPRLTLKAAHMVLVFQGNDRGSNGSVSLSAASDYGRAEARSDFRFAPGGIDLANLNLDGGGLKVRGSLALRARAPSEADLILDVGPGAFLDAGRVFGTAKISDDRGGLRAVLDLKADRLRPRGSTLSVRSAQVKAEGSLDRLPYMLEARGVSGQGPWTVKGQGRLDTANPGYVLTLEGLGTLGNRDLHTLEPAVFRISGDTQSARVRLAGSDGGRLDLDGNLRGDSADIRARVTAMGLNLLDSDFDGRIDADLNLQGRGDRLDGVLIGRLMDARGRGTPAAQGISGTLRGRLADSLLTVDLETTNGQGLKANANLILPAESSARPFRVALARKKPMRGRFFAEGEVRPIWELVIGGERALSGFVKTEGVLGGSIAKPEATGTISVARGRFDDGSSGLSLREVAVTATFNEDAVDVTQADGVDGRGGRLSGQGRISLLPDGVSSFRLELNGFRLIDNETATATATGPATINRAADGKVKLTGDLTIDRGDVAADPLAPTGVVAMDVREVNRPEDLPVAFAGARKKGDGWALDVTLKAPRRVFLRGRGLDVETSLDAHVGGTTANTNLTGTARVVRGDYDFAGKRFAFDETSVVYLSSRPQNIRLQLDATREDPTLKVTVRIRGTAARPEITLASSPSLPNDEVLSKVLFERSASQLSPVEAAQLASALSSLTGGGGLDVIGNLKSFAGLDRLAFGGGLDSSVTVSGGKYLTDNVYLELTGGGREGPSAQVEWRLRRNLSILSRLAGQSGNRLAVRWRKDY